MIITFFFVVFVSAAKVKRTALSTKHPNIVNRLQHGNHIQSDLSSPQPSPYSVLSPAYSVQSQNNAEHSCAAQSYNNVYSLPESPMNSSENSSQQCLDSPLSMSLIGSEQYNCDEHVAPNLLPCESILTGVMDLNFSDIDCSVRCFIASQTAGRYGDRLHYEEDAGNESCTSFETGSTEVIVQTGNGHSSLESNCTGESPTSIESSPLHNEDVANMIQMENNALQEPVTSTVHEQPIECEQSQSNLAHVFALLNVLTTEELKCIHEHVERGVYNETTQVMELESTVMTSDSTPGLTSSGMSDAFNFRYGMVFGYD